MRIVFLVALLFLLSTCAKKQKKDELHISVTDNSGKLLTTLHEDALVKVDWEEQCYHFTKPVVDQLQRLNLNHATIELVFNYEVQASWKVVTVYEAELQTTLILECDPDTGKIKMDDNICVGNMRYDYYFGIRSNEHLEAYLRKINLLSM